MLFQGKVKRPRIYSGTVHGVLESDTTEQLFPLTGIGLQLLQSLGRVQSAGSVAKSRTRLGDFTFTFHFNALKKAMAIHSSTLAWRIPWTQESGGLPSTGSHRVRHDWNDLAS